MVLIDKDRVSFESLGIDELARKLGLLEPLKNVPTQNAASYKGVEVDVACAENKEPLVDVCDYGIKSVPYYREQAKGNPTYGKNIKGAPDVNFVRKGTADRLLEANEKLSSLDLELVVLDGHRSPTTQNVLFASFKEKYFEKRGVGMVDMTPENKSILDAKRKFYDEEAKKFALDFCSSAENFDAKDPKTWTIHSTGGAVDVYLLDKRSGKVVDMGEGYFDNPDNVTLTNHYECKAGKTSKEEGYMNARRVLYNVMTSVGMVNYGNECFHFSYKDQYHGCVTGQKAKYGYVQSPKDRSLSNIVQAVKISKSYQ
jgi:D-alanyl-D-alanine dipeptidase